MYIHSYSKNNDHFLYLTTNIKQETCNRQTCNRQTCNQEPCNKETNSNDLCKKIKYGYLHYVFHPEDQIAIITYIFIPNRLRGLGWSKRLMEQFFVLIHSELENHNLEYIDIFLDDVSERFGQKDNLYLKFGFEYVEEQIEILENINQIRQIPLGPEMKKRIYAKRNENE